MALSLDLLRPLRRHLSRDPIPRALFDARVTHARFEKRSYTLAHRLAYVALPLDALPRLDRRFIGRNRARLYALHDRDYGQTGLDLTTWVSAAFRQSGLAAPDPARVVLVTLPRVAGFAFNPVSFWMCHDAAGALTAVLAEVNNTFGERHCYLCRKPDGSPIGADEEIVAEKVFHVSPFLPVDGVYRFRFAERGDRLAIRIDLYRDGCRALTATIAGRLTDLTSWSLLTRFLKHPFPSLQVLVFIHYHALRLYMRGLAVFTKPAPPSGLVTASDTAARTPSLEHAQ